MSTSLRTPTPLSDTTPTHHTNVQLLIPDITCNSCINTIKNAFKDVQYIENTEIDLKCKIATIRYDNTAHTVQHIIDVLTDIGYTATTDIHTPIPTPQKSQPTKHCNTTNNALGANHILNIEFCTSCGYYNEYATISQQLRTVFPLLTVVCNTTPARMKTFEITVDNHVLVYSKLATGTFPTDINALCRDIERTIIQLDNTITPYNLYRKLCDNTDTNERIALISLTALSIVSIVCTALFYKQNKPHLK